MRRSRLLRLSCFFLLVVCSCGKSLPDLEGFDKQSWIEDQNGCLKKRQGMKAVIEREKEKLLSLDELKIVAALGKPDANQLYKRNQKFFHYYIDPAPECNQTQASSPLKLVIRFNAMGLAKEIYTE